MPDQRDRKAPAGAGGPHHERVEPIVLTADAHGEETVFLDEIRVRRPDRQLHRERAELRAEPFDDACFERGPHRGDVRQRQRKRVTGDAHLDRGLVGDPLEDRQEIAGGDG